MRVLGPILALSLMTGCGSEEEISKLREAWFNHHNGHRSSDSDKPLPGEIEPGGPAASNLPDPEVDSASPEICAEQSVPVLSLSDVKVLVLYDAASATFQFTNQSADAIWFYGYSKRSPIYNFEGQRSEDEWASLRGWCGNGLENQILVPGETLNVVAPLSSLNEGMRAFRISIHFSVGPCSDAKAFYSPEISLPMDNDSQ